MSAQPLKLAIIIGSVREGRFGPVVANWFAQQVDDRFDVDIIDLADAEVHAALPAMPPALEPDPQRPAGMGALTERLSAADAYVIVTPDYNRSYPAALKAAIDWHFTQWDAKAIGFVGYSGGSGGLLAIEHLRQVFAELNAHTVRNYVSFPRYYLLFDENGQLREPAEFEAAAQALLDQLHWWTSALVAARAARVAA
ncbi:NAD(P)H-dependent oxidoreductase [Nocardia asteroides NBRC 15531]|uniref:Oxidoreductase n=1 Tax=Nocardia asteroides NBRC 15531 TaxID=1110697 RepID=U5E8V4_NOCAS|nr:NAD(P)H-dependent oxidoreductase [Nocardia asteroides]TLF70361.1 NAD(P)H-dependent oxidoreductase [Nocardia asteroides NBRC 15531]UGT49892.1 NAD(P)H-dependent oxidoreductase [Nocardia asteroides]SFN26136.1 NAD(P)H-dependent FMN reductase [Nocardia asteroides]VEG37355.1 FMN-dependent NADPH-azoreductase [Nocardia asteroides]GAD81584.1 putative oxidoreductase [Nocardia asteroides NBRC 15531]